MTTATRELQRFDMFIGGEPTGARSGEVMPSFDPYRGADWAEVPRADREDVDRAVAAARVAFDDGPWPRMTGQQRGRLMLRLAGLIEEHADELATVEVQDNGKLFREMSAQFRTLIPDYFYYFAGAADKIEGDVFAAPRPNYFVYSLREPVGVVAAVTAWNSPALLMTYKLSSALAAGCTFVLKPSSAAPVSALAFSRLVAEAGIPDGVFNVVTGEGGSVGEYLVAHPQVDKVAFTGSTEAGLRVARLAASHLAPVSLELGGKSAQIVFPDADPEAVVNGVTAGVFAACGQTCVAGSRLLVHRSVHDSIVSRIVDRARRIQLGDPMLPETEMGPLASPAQFERVMGYIEAGRSEGATVATGGRKPPGLQTGLFVEPTVFTDVASSMTIAREEIFGPVLSVIPFEGEEEAVRLANDVPYDLATGIWTRDLQRAHRLARAARTGIVWINGYRMFAPQVPFGGNGRSGYGREGGQEGLREFLHTKSVWVEISGETRDPFRLG